MPKTINTNSSPRDKLLSIYRRMQDGRRHFQANLAREENCSAQTISRVISIIEGQLGKNELVESGLEGRRRYYRLQTKHRDVIPAEALHQLVLCRNIAKQSLPSDAINQIDKTLAVLASQVGEPAPPNGNIGFHHKGVIKYTPHMELMTRVAQAIEKKQICRVTYRANGREEANVYRYAPGQILAMNGALYVEGYRVAEGSVLQDKPTTFLIHRIQAFEPTGEYFHFNAEGPKIRYFGMNWHAPKRMRIRFAPEVADYVCDRIWSDDQVIEQLADGGVILDVSTTSEKELQAWVWSFGDLAKIENVASAPSP